MNLVFLEFSYFILFCTGVSFLLFMKTFSKFVNKFFILFLTITLPFDILMAISFFEMDLVFLIFSIIWADLIIITVADSSLKMGLKEYSMGNLTLLLLIPFYIFIFWQVVRGNFGLLSLTTTASMGLYYPGDLVVYALIIYRFCFVLFFYQGVINGNTLRTPDKYFTQKIGSVFIILTIILFSLEVLGLGIKWPFLYAGVFYFGFFLIFQTINLILVLVHFSRYRPRLLSSFRFNLNMFKLILTTLQLIIIIFIVENLNVFFSDISPFFFLALYFLHFLGYSVGFRYKDLSLDEE